MEVGGQVYTPATLHVDVSVPGAHWISLVGLGAGLDALAVEKILLL